MSLNDDANASCIHRVSSGDDADRRNEPRAAELEVAH